MEDGESGRSRQLGLLASSLLAAAVVAYLGYILAQGGRWPGEMDLLLAWQGGRGTALEAVMVAASYVGYALPVFGPLVIVVGALLWRQRGSGEALFVIAPTVIAYGISFAIKHLVQRPRPGGDGLWVYTHLVDFGFPSQHAVTYVTFFGLLCYLAARRWQGEPYRWPTLIVGGLLILLVGPSRIFLAAHWPSDVLAGYLLGYSIWALTVLSQASWLQRLAPSRREVER